MSDGSSFSRKAAPGLGVALLALCCAMADPTVTLRIAVRARALAPGEPVRVEAVASTPLEALEGELLGRPIEMVRLGPVPAGGERWTGWALVTLDQAAGPATVELRGRTPDDRAAHASLAVTIEDKRFPEERLTVESRYVAPPKEVTERLAREREKLDAIYASRATDQSALEPFVRPVPGAPTSIFGLRRIYNGEPKSPHPGLDLRAATGTPVVASGPGRIVLAQDLYYSGNTVIVDHGGGLFTIYAHLSRIDAREGDAVRAGQRLGLSGATGRVTGPHLHWGAKIGDLPFDPTALLDAALFPASEQ